MAQVYVMSTYECVGLNDGVGKVTPLRHCMSRWMNWTFNFVLLNLIGVGECATG